MMDRTLSIIRGILKKPVHLFCMACMLCLISPLSFGQSGQKWATGGNSISAGDFLGTTNNLPFVLKVNNKQALQVNVDGTMLFNSYSGTGNRLLMVDNTGLLSSFNFSGNTGDVLFGDGTWHPLPVSPPAGWSILGNRVGNPIFYIVSNPNSYVGIGTNSPSKPLTVSGAVLADTILVNNQIALNNSLLIEGINTYSTVTKIKSYTDLWINSVAVPVVYRQIAPPAIVNTIINGGNSGNVGIGTFTPGVKLDVSGTVRSSGMIVAHGSLRTDSDLVVSGNTTMSKSLSLSGDMNLGGNLTLAKTLSLSNGLNVTGNINNTGMLNTTELSVSGNITNKGTLSTAYLNLTNALIVDTIYSRKQVVVNQGLSLQGDNGLSPGTAVNAIDAGNSDLLIQSQGRYPLQNTIINAKSNGFVGIGTFTPKSKLDVQGDIHSSGNIIATGLRLTNSLTLDTIYSRKILVVSQGITVQGNNGQYGSKAVNAIDAANTDLMIQSQGLFPDLNTIINAKSRGNVGIGTFNPQAKLDVNGNIQAEGSVSTTGDLNTDGNLSAGGLLFVRGGISTKGDLSARNGSLYNLQVNGALHAMSSLQVDSNFIVSGNLVSKGNLIFAGDKTISYYPAGNGRGDMFLFGTPSSGRIGIPPPIADPCLFPSTTINGFSGVLCAYGTSANGGAINALTMGFDGANGVIDMAGTTTLPAGPGLLINYYCGKDVYMCTGAGANTTQTGNVNICNGPNSKGGVFLGITHIGPQILSTGPHIDAVLTVSGKMVVKSCYVTLDNWADYVFDSGYKLPKLVEVEKYYLKNKHLEEIPTEKEIKEKGVDVAEMNRLLLKKVEELTLYIVEQQKQIDNTQQGIKELKAKLTEQGK
jgi:hypothetical protein